MKRGTIELAFPHMFTTTLVLGIILLTLLRAIYGIGSSQDYEMQFYAADTALMIDGLYSVSPDLNLAVNYAKILPGFEFAFQPQLVEVSATGTERNKTFWFTGDTKYNFKPSTIPNATILTFARTGNTITVQNGIKTTGVNLAIPFCKAYTGAGLRDILLSVTPRTELLANYFKSWNPDLFGEGTGGVIGLGAGAEGGVKIFATKTDAGARLACLVAQALTEKFPATPVALIPLNTAYLPEGDPKTILKFNVPSIFIEFPTELLNKPRELAEALYKGVQKYGLA